MRILILVLLFPAPEIAAAQSAPPTPLTGEEAVALAVKNNSRLSAAVQRTMSGQSNIIGYGDDPKEEGSGIFLIKIFGGSSRDGVLHSIYVRTYMNDAGGIQ